MTPLELNDLVYEQWLMADIQESSVPRLPGEIGNVEICKVEGYLNLQVGQLITKLCVNVHKHEEILNFWTNQQAAVTVCIHMTHWTIK